MNYIPIDSPESVDDAEVYRLCKVLLADLHRMIPYGESKSNEIVYLEGMLWALMQEDEIAKIFLEEL